MSQNKDQHSKDISRKAALKKMGSYAAFAALGTIIMLNPQKAQAQSVPPAQGGGFPGSGFRSTRKNRNKK
jgi:hypothetical protein